MEVREDDVLGGADCCRESEVEVGEEDDHGDAPWAVPEDSPRRGPRA